VEKTFTLTKGYFKNSQTKGESLPPQYKGNLILSVITLNKRALCQVVVYGVLMAFGSRFAFLDQKKKNDGHTYLLSNVKRLTYATQWAKSPKKQSVGVYF